MKLTRLLGGVCALLSLGLAFSAQASLIGDTVNFQCTNCAPPTNDNFVVVEGGAPELTLLGAFEIDVEDASLRINWIIDATSILSSINFVWSDLDWVNMTGEITAVTIDPSSTWGISPAVTIGFGGDFVSVTNNGDQTVSTGDFLLLNLDVAHVPIPAAAWLFGSGLLGLVGMARRKKA